MIRQVKAVPVKVGLSKTSPVVRVRPANLVGCYEWWTAAFDAHTQMSPYVVFDNPRSARANAREFWAQYGCKVRFVK